MRGLWIISMWCVVTGAVTQDLVGYDGVAQDRVVHVTVEDAETGLGIPARIYLVSSDGKPYFFESSSPEGSAVRYEKKNWINASSVEYHTTVSAHPCAATVPPGAYELTIERGQCYQPYQQSIQVSEDDVHLDAVRLRRWADPMRRNWYSGDLHIHRTLAELRTVVLAEELNVVMPLTNWVTKADTPPSAGDKNLSGDLPDELIRLDEKHVIWPRNTEYEIFSVGGKRHTLGALFVLGHREPLQETVPPWKEVVRTSRQLDPKVIFDMDKLAWPFAMTLPVIAPDAVYELANNHLWRTEFAFRQWYTPAPPYIQPPFGGTEGGESQWIDFTLGMWYTLLNCGFRLPPGAGTANGVHPVPAGFSRVYVHLPDGFDFDRWRKALQAGRSFVTTGPMLYATADQQDPGHEFAVSTNDPAEIAIRAEVLSQFPITFGEILVNGVPRHLLRAQSRRTDSGAFRYVFEKTITVDESGWFAVRVFEDRPNGRVRFAHTAPWYSRVEGSVVRPSRDQRAYLIGRMTNEIQRSRGVVSEAALTEYQQALDHYRSIQAADVPPDVLANARPLTDQDRERWLRNMIVDHRFTADEVRAATGMPIDQCEAAVEKYSSLVAESEKVSSLNETKPLEGTAKEQRSSGAHPIRMLPYPGGRHPRRGFLDGAIQPQRETKISVFAPWDDGGYAVIDVPEAIFSNLGLTYLAHTHVPTIWTDRDVELEPLEWQSKGDAFEVTRRLPNGIAFQSHVELVDDAVHMRLSLTNGTDQPLSGLRTQVCVMLKGLIGFNAQRRRPTMTRGPLIAVPSDSRNRWLITAWTPHHRSWANPPVPCVHSDPIFPDCRPGQTVTVRGALWFYEGDDIESELDRLARSFSTQAP